MPKVALPGALDYKNLFRVIIMHFIDAHAFDVRSVKKACVHIAHPDGRIIPFDTYNLFYDDLEKTRLDPVAPRGALMTTTVERRTRSIPSSPGMIAVFVADLAMAVFT